MVLESARLSSASDVTCAAHGVQTQSLCSPVKNTCILNNAVSGAVPASNTAMVNIHGRKWMRDNRANIDMDTLMQCEDVCPKSAYEKVGTRITPAALAQKYCVTKNSTQSLAAV